MLLLLLALSHWTTQAFTITSHQAMTPLCKVRSVTRPPLQVPRNYRTCTGQWSFFLVDNNEFLYICGWTSFAYVSWNCDIYIYIDSWMNAIEVCKVFSYYLLQSTWILHIQDGLPGIPVSCVVWVMYCCSFHMQTHVRLGILLLLMTVFNCWRIPRTGLLRWWLDRQRSSLEVSSTV